ncbi:hypothetical protein G9A89_017146 [Geosiphon pyriformis]|nr:hypothetical protein G9A89_017146 [Geosiphon pyriformis]
MLDVLNSTDFLDVHSSLLDVWLNCIEVYTDGSLKNTGSAKVSCGAMAYFLAANVSIGVRVFGLLFSILAELQAIALALECVLASCAVALYLDSQSAIDVCVSEASLLMSDFCSQYWIEQLHIANLIKNKDISVKWVKVKGHLGIFGNIKTDKLASKTTASFFILPVEIREQFLVAKDTAVSGNACYFICDIYRSICCACWKTGPRHNIILNDMLKKVNWVVTTDIWHLDSHMFSEFTSRKSANICTYLMKVVHRWLLVAVRKRLYNKNYPGILCLLCSKMKLPNHVFTCSGNAVFWEEILVEAASNCKDSLREDPRQWIDFSSASEKEYINTHNNQELKNNLHRNSKKKAFSVTVTLSHK